MNRSAIRRRTCRLKGAASSISGCYTVGFPLFTHLRIDVENRDFSTSIRKISKPTPVEHLFSGLSKVTA
jgi:hypothetical protein